MSKAKNVSQFLVENEDEIKSGLKIAGQAVEAASDIHQKVEKEEEKAAGEMSESESMAERDTAQAAKGTKKELDDIAEAESGLKKGLDSMGQLVDAIGKEENSIDSDLQELKRIGQTLQNNPGNLEKNDIGTVVQVADEAYSLIDDEINVEDKLAGYYVKYSTGLEKLVGAEEASEQDLKHLEDESKTEAKRTGHKQRINKLISFENKETEEFKQEVSRLKKELGEEEEELVMLQKEIQHTKEEVKKFIQELEGLESVLYDLGYEEMASKLEKIRESLQQDESKLSEAENELSQAESISSEAESEVANI